MSYNYDRLFKIGLYTGFVFAIYHVSVYVCGFYVIREHGQTCGICAFVYLG